jgi:hypothetical protein
MTDLEKQLVTALRHAWQELNTIRARDGRPFHRDDGMPYCTEEWWNELTEMCDAAIKTATGEPPKPWPFKWELNEQDSATFVDAVLNPSEPNDALKAAASSQALLSLKNRLRSLYNIDGWLLPELTTEQQLEFIANPPRYLINTDVPQSKAIWREVEKRQRRSP